MDWFERITGFPETTAETIRSRLAVEGDQLVSRVNGSRHGIGRLRLCSLNQLRELARALPAAGQRTRLSTLAGDVRALHRQPENAGALFQVASQFNLLEMVSPEVSPEHGVTRYAHDMTQGPACAMAAGAATIYRNYFVPVDGEPGQTSSRQIDTLRPLGEALATRLGRPRDALWAMRNGYALCTADGLAGIGSVLGAASEASLDTLRGQLRIGLHEDVEVTDAPGPKRPRVSQAFCSALPVAYSPLAPSVWEPFARLVLEAAYEATLLAAAEARQRGASARVLLTRLGGGAFGNQEHWIDDAMQRALRRVEWAGLEVCLVSFGSSHPANLAIARRWAEAG
jgi:hypothetical protein